MNVKLSYCNSIDEGEVTIHRNHLNIKYGINGVGKTTIARAIQYHIDDVNNGTDRLQSLKPFKYHHDEQSNPSIGGIDGTGTVKVFDENYIEKFLFLEDELVKGSFEIFIYSREYQEGLDRIDDLISDIAVTFANNRELDQLIEDFKELSGCFGRPVASGIHGSSRLAKALRDVNKIIHVPDGLESYQDFLDHEDNYKWLAWQINGNNYLDISMNCPFCTSDIEKEKEKIELVKKEYKPKDIEHLNNLVEIFQKLDKYFSDDTREVIDNFITNIDGYTDDEISFLLEVRDQIDRLSTKLYNIKTMNFQSLKDVDAIIEQINKYKINLSYMNHLNSKETQEKIGFINRALEEIGDKAEYLQGMVNRQKILLERTIGENKKEINSFLKNAGYNYYVDIIDEDGTYRLKLRHQAYSSEIDNVESHLSFGERNAFALVLFMYEALNEEPDLIILDDPISSFDSNKKYAIIDMLFRRTVRGLRGKTVLMLTHDFDPILDMVYHHTDRFQIPKAYFLENNKGVLTEKEIMKEDIKTFLDILKENIVIAEEDINKLIYLRKLYELNNDRGSAYQLLSNLFHKRANPIYSDYVCKRFYKGNTEECSLKMNDLHIAIAMEEVSRYVPGFKYSTFLNIMRDEENLVQLYKQLESNYEKLQIYRIISEGYEDDGIIGNDIVRKFINECYHIENDYIYQLNPLDYQTVPQFIIDECDKVILEIEHSYNDIA